MATEQLKQRDDTTMVEKQGVPESRSQFEAIVETEKKSTKGSETGEDSEQPKGTKGCPQNQRSAETVKATLTSAAKTTKDYAAPIAEKAKDYTVQKAVAAKDAAEGLKEKAVVAGWSTAQYTCETAVEGTKAAGRLVKGAAESMKEYTARKKEEAEREAMYKKKCMNEEKKEAFGGEEGKEQCQSAATKEHIA